jgi:hypothetical protein
MDGDKIIDTARGWKIKALALLIWSIAIACIRSNEARTFAIAVSLVFAVGVFFLAFFIAFGACEGNMWQVLLCATGL